MQLRLTKGHETLQWLQDTPEAIEGIRYFDWQEAGREIHISVLDSDKLIAMGGFQQNPHDPEQLWIKFISTKPEFRQQGAARLIYQAVYRYAAEHGLKIAPGGLSTDGTKMVHIHDEMAKLYPQVAYERDQRGNYVKDGKIVRSGDMSAMYEKANTPLKTYLELLSEAANIPESFTTDPSLSWQNYDDAKWGNRDASFEINGETFVVTFAQAMAEDYFAEKVWVVEFKKKSGRAQRSYTEGPRALRIFASVVAAVREFIKIVDPVAWGFTGDKSTGLSNVYDKIVKKLEAEIKAANYTRHAVKGHHSNGVLFYKADQIDLNDLL